MTDAMGLGSSKSLSTCLDVSVSWWPLAVNHLCLLVETSIDTTL